MVHAMRPLNEGRGVNPGDSPESGRQLSKCQSPLNEGRGVNPGDRREPGLQNVHSLGAQRRPGGEPRRQVADPKHLVVKF